MYAKHDIAMNSSAPLAAPKGNIGMSNPARIMTSSARTKRSLFAGT